MEILRCFDESHRLTQRRYKHLVPRHPEGLCQAERCRAVAIHRPLAKIATAGSGFHAAEEIVDRPGNGLPIGALQMGVARAQKGQQPHRRARRRAVQRARIAAGAVAAASGQIKPPRAVGGLMKRQPGQSPLDSRLAAGRSSSAEGRLTAGRPPP